MARVLCRARARGPLLLATLPQGRPSAISACLGRRWRPGGSAAGWLAVLLALPAPLAALAPLALLASGCGDGRTFAPIVDAPPPGSDGDPYLDLEELRLEVARAGDPIALASAAFARGEAPVLADVPAEPNLVVHLSGRSGGIDVAYGRTCAADLDKPGALPTTHLYFSRIVKWADGPTPTTPTRMGGLVVAAVDGSATFVGGSNAAGAPLLGAERFDPRSGAFTSLAALVPRLGGVVAALGDGRSLLLGGVDAAGVPVDRYELISPLAPPARQVEVTVDANLRLVGSAASALADGRVVVVGGKTPDAGGVLQVSDLLWLFATGEGGALEAPRALPAHLTVARAGHTVTRLGDGPGAPLLVAGGLDGAGATVPAAELYRPLRETFADPSEVRLLMRTPRSRHQAVTMPDGSVLVIGGVDAAGVPVARLEVFSLEAGFSDAGTLPAEAGLVDFSATVLPDGRVLLVGGRRAPDGPALDGAFIIRLDPLNGVVDVVGTDRLAAPRAGHAAAALCDGTVLVLGGAAAGAPGTERYNPPATGRR